MIEPIRRRRRPPLAGRSWPLAARLAVPAALLGLALGLAPPVAPAAPAAPTPAPPCGPAGEQVWPETESGRFLFFAVLEGLFLDGVQDEVVTAVLDGPPGARFADAGPERVWDATLEQGVFVPGCGLCTPALAAFETYRARGAFRTKPPWHPGRTRDAFGGGLPAETVARLLHPERAERLAALETLVSGWVVAGLDRRRATPAERASLALWMEDARKRGMMQLRDVLADRPELRASWRACAFCDGAVGGCAPEQGPGR